MASNPYIMKRVLLLLFLIVSATSFAQSRIGIHAGIGIPDFLYIGGKYQFKQLEAGLQLGTFPSRSHKLFGIGGHLMWHFAGESDHLEARPWYVKGDVVYNYDENSSYYWHTCYTGMRVGRECALSERLSLQIDLGFSYVAYQDMIAKKPTSSDYSPGISVFPAGSITAFYSF